MSGWRVPLHEIWQGGYFGLLSYRSDSMARPAVISVEDKFRLVLSFVSGEMTVAEAARRSKVSEQSVGNWKRQFLEGGKQGLADGGRAGSSPQVQRLRTRSRI
jgi:transposase-like protein